MKIPKEIIDRIRDQAEAEYPSECCGMVLGSDLLEVRPCENVYDKYHVSDPEAYPRTARTAYLIDPLIQMRIFQEARDSGRPVRLIYHSHVDAEAYFSEEDQRVAAAFDRVPTFPNVDYLVVATEKGKAIDHRLFKWSESEREFVESKIEIV